MMLKGKLEKWLAKRWIGLSENQLQALDYLSKQKDWVHLFQVEEELNMPWVELQMDILDPMTYTYVLRMLKRPYYKITTTGKAILRFAVEKRVYRP